MKAAGCVGFILCAYFLIYPLTYEAATARCKGAEACVYEEIFANYNKLVRPVKETDQVIHINLQLVVRSLLDLAAKDEIMRMVGYFVATWYDDLLKWSPTQHSNVTEIVVPAEEIWIPDIGITNSDSTFYDVTYKRDFHVKIGHSGRIVWSFGGILTTNCDIDLKYYPFDKQQCDIEVESWKYEINEVHLDYYAEEPVDTSKTKPHPEWILDKSSGKRSSKYNDKYSVVVFSLEWSRKPLYYYVNIILPNAYLVIITLGIFWLPMDCDEKISLAVAVVVAFSVFQVIIMDNTPVSSDSVPKLTEMVITVMCIATVSVLTSMLISYLRNRSIPPPRWLKKLFLCSLPRITRTGSHTLGENEEFGGNTNPDEEGITLKHYRVNERQFPDESTSETQLRTTPSTSARVNKGMHKAAKEAKRGHVRLCVLKKRKTDKKNTRKYRSRQRRLTRDRIFLLRHTKEILEQLEYIKGQITLKEQDEKIKDEWKYIGRRVDRTMFFVCFIILIFYILFTYFTVKYGD